jgi:N-acetylmuramoyl-L-alanine amidase
METFNSTNVNMNIMSSKVDIIKSTRPEPNKSAINQPFKPLGFLSSLLKPKSQLPRIVPYLGNANGRPISSIIIHCTATPEGKAYSVADINAWHRARGFEMIGYHYVILLNGEINIGRPVSRVGAHTQNHNNGTIGISYVGGMNSSMTRAKDTRTRVQKASGRALIDALLEKFPGIHSIHGHNEFAQKACPSFIVRNDDWGKMP